MKIRLRNLVAVDVSQTDDQAVKLRFVTASKDEVIVVITQGLLREFLNDLSTLSSEEESPAANGQEPDFEEAMRGIMSKGLTRVA